MLVVAIILDAIASLHFLCTMICQCKFLCSFMCTSDCRMRICIQSFHVLELLHRELLYVWIIFFAILFSCIHVSKIYKWWQSRNNPGFQNWRQFMLCFHRWVSPQTLLLIFILKQCPWRQICNFASVALGCFLCFFDLNSEHKYGRSLLCLKSPIHWVSNLVCDFLLILSSSHLFTSLHSLS